MEVVLLGRNGERVGSNEGISWSWIEWRFERWRFGRVWRNRLVIARNVARGLGRGPNLGVQSGIPECSVGCLRLPVVFQAGRQSSDSKL